MYETIVTTPDAAVSHLFLHCCFKDGELSETEVDEISDKAAILRLDKDVNFKDVLLQYKSYRDEVINNEGAYLQHLIKLINPTSQLALYSYCTELSLSDAALDFAEKQMLDKLAALLEVDEATQSIVQHLMVERKVVATQKYF